MESHFNKPFHPNIHYGITVGRRQPMHIVHLDCIKEIIDAGLEAVIIIGSTNTPEQGLFDPLKNPLTKEQQEIFIKQALTKEGISKYRILSLKDRGNIKQWSKDLHDLLVQNNIKPQESVFHYREKSIDTVKPKGIIAPLSNYTQEITNWGITIWAAKNQDNALDEISSTTFRSIDLYGQEFLAQKSHLIAADLLVEFARKARETNSEISHLPLSMLDLSLARIKSESGSKIEIFKEKKPESLTELKLMIAQLLQT